MNGKQAKKQRKEVRRSADDMNKVLSLANIEKLHQIIKESDTTIKSLKYEISNHLLNLAKADKHKRIIYTIFAIYVYCSLVALWL